MRKNNNAKQEFRELRLRLKAIDSRREDSLLKRFNESVFLINAFLSELRERVTTVAFKDQIGYFSEIGHAFRIYADTPLRSKLIGNYGAKWPLITF